ncbi:MAG: hypothetical protein ACRCRU_01765 [Vibrio sp.]|uniref:hypothetical protein n=1 Tax=Vibrio sp. TaxID=678 RepID=UPI003F372171
MKKNSHSLSFTDLSKPTCVVVTVTNWDEPPRIRHEVSKQLSREFNVLYFQLFQTSKVKRRVEKINDSLIVDKVGFGFRGIGRLFKYFNVLHKIYRKSIAILIANKLKKIPTSSSLILVNFQYDFPEIMEMNCFEKAFYFCNDDFINQDLNCTGNETRKKERLQLEVIQRSDAVITVSYPLKYNIDKHHSNVSVILSGHSFDLDLSRRIEHAKQDKIHVCYMGFLNNGISIDWLNSILSNENMFLTIIGPIEIPEVGEDFYKYKNFKHIKFLTGNELQLELMKHDVMLMPYSSPIENAVTTVPAKLFQYLAVGKPIVSSSLENLIELPDGFVYKSKTQHEFIENIKKSVLDDSELMKEERIQFSSKHTWYTRGNELIELLNDGKYNQIS